MLLLGQVRLLLRHFEADAVTPLVPFRNVQPDVVDLVVGDALIPIQVIHIEGDAQFLNRGAHGCAQHETDEFVMVNSLIAVFIYLRHDASPDDRR